MVLFDQRGKIDYGKKIERSSERRTIEKNITSFLSYKRI